jgi:ankyrin repeat protein
VAAGGSRRIQTLIEHGARIDSRDIGGWTLLGVAVLNGRATVIRTLLELGADINGRREDPDERAADTTALMAAAAYGNEEIIQLLLENGADPTLSDRDSMTAATWATRQGHHEIAAKLSVAHA